MTITTCQSYSLGIYTPQKGSVLPKVPQMTSLIVQMYFSYKKLFFETTKKGDIQMHIASWKINIFWCGFFCSFNNDEYFVNNE